MRKILAVTAVAAVAGFVGLWVKNKRPKKLLPRQQVVEMLRKVDQESYMILCQMATVVGQLLKEQPARPPEEIKQMFESEESGFPDLFKQLYSNLYEQFGTTEQEFEYSIEKGYHEDPEIQFYRKRLAEDFHKALLGSTPDIDRALPIELPPEKVLGIVSSILEEQLRIFQEGLKRIRQPVTVEQFQLVSDSVLEEFKMQLLAKEGLNSFRQRPQKLMEFSVGKYMVLDDKFRHEYELIHSKYEQRMKELIAAHPHLFTC